MSIGHTQNEIDDMDIIYHLQLLGRKKQEKSGTTNNEPIYADDIFDNI